MSQVEPMTAAEYGDWCNVGLGVNTERVLAALEERERLLGERAVLVDERDRAKHEAAEVRRLCETDASLGALVRRIREHPMRKNHLMVTLRAGGEVCTRYADEYGLTSILSHLDSLLPVEPKVVTGPSGWQYKRSGNGDIITMISEKSGWTTGKGIPVEDAPVVAALMAKESGK